ncbi:acyl-CoA Delta-9 desaturase-like [Chrysoperla carnea]|uniref:acyl-CoA Delta-9 desaturase-like n=1 Tax=Chrysoperla carnea TaxID=189513 RepID=UPI001D061E69|nr:acyl-CoA Delta-9 desaturase-like [Chrysoperla carnea]
MAEDAFVLYLVSLFSFTAGSHRLWSHRAYKAKWQLRLLLVIFQTISFQDVVYVWVLFHRLHHKYTDTNADPHNSKRGFFYAQIGWIMLESHPDQIEKRKTIDMSDLKSDPIIRFQIRYYFRLLFLFFAFLPTVIPWYLWNETLTNSWFVAVALRHLFSLHITSLVNSWAHMWGNQPYEKGTTGRETLLLSIMTLGEAWHNYHHTFPWDYKASELGGGRINATTFVLKNIFGKIGWAYDFKTVSDDMIQKRIERTGDGSYSPTIWGWGDRDQTEDNKSFATIEKF